MDKKFLCAQKFLNLVGLWPEEEKDLFRGKNLMKLLLTLIFTLMVDYLMGKMLYDKVFKGERESNFELIEVCSDLLCGLVMLFYAVYYSFVKPFHQLKSSLKNVENHFVPEDVEENERLGTLFTKMIVYGFLSVGVIYFGLPAFTKKSCEEMNAAKNLTYNVECGFGIKIRCPFKCDTFPGYHIMFVLSYICGCMFVIISLSITGVNVTAVLHIIGHIRCLKKHIQSAAFAEEKRTNLNECIEYHTSILEYCELIDEYFTVVNFILFVGSTCIMSFLAFEATALDSVGGAWRFLLHFLGWVLNIYTKNYVSQMLLDEGVSLEQEIYNCEWQNYDVYIQHDLVFFLKRAQKPLGISWGSFGMASLEVFYSIMGTTYTYYTLLVSSQNQ